MNKLGFKALNRLRHFCATVSWKARHYENVILEERIPRLILGKRPNSFPLVEVEVHMLLGAKTWLMALWAASSFESASESRWLWVFQDDGTLTKKQKACLITMFPHCEIRSRSDSDKRMCEAMKNFPACLAAREKHVMCMKLFDPFFYSDRDRYILLDSDVLFFRKPTEILDWAVSDDPSFVFNKDIKSSYAISADRLSSRFNVDMLEKANAGLALIPRGGIDLSIVESYLAEFSGDSSHDLWLEQTAYALLGSKDSRSSFLPNSYEISFSPRRHPDCVARHYVGGSESRPHYFREGVIFLSSKLL